MLVFKIICGLLLLLIVFAMGYIFAAMSVLIGFKVGTLRIDENSPVKDRYIFEIDNFEKLHTKGYALMKVVKTRDDQSL